MKRLLILLFLSSILGILWPDTAAAQGNSPASSDSSNSSKSSNGSPAKFELRTFAGAFTHRETREPLVGLRALLDVPTVAGLHLVVRGDALALSDGGAVEADLANVPAFRSGELFVAAYRPVFGAFSIECAAGAAMSFEPGADLARSSPRIWGCGLGYHLGDTRAAVLLGAHQATGKGQRILASLTLPVRGQTALQVDCAGGGDSGFMCRSGVGVSF